jgi:RNA methyltransferase, TrmH family
MLTKTEIKFLKSLQIKKNRDEEKCFLVEGKRSVEEAINYKHGIEVILITHELADKNIDLINKLNDLSIRYEVLNAKDVDSISDVQNSQGIIAKVNYLNSEEDNLFLKNSLKKRFLVLDGIADPGNMGTIIRTADWFGMDGIITCNNSVDIYNPKVVRSTMGSIFHLPIIESEQTPELMKKLKEKKFFVFAADIEGEPYKETTYPANTVIVFGNEAHGISEGISQFIDKKITIPKEGNAESLNVAISAGIIMSHIVS